MQHESGHTSSLNSEVEVIFATMVGVEVKLRIGCTGLALLKRQGGGRD